MTECGSPNILHAQVDASVLDWCKNAAFQGMESIVWETWLSALCICWSEFQPILMHLTYLEAFCLNAVMVSCDSDFDTGSRTKCEFNEASPAVILDVQLHIVILLNDFQ